MPTSKPNSAGLVTRPNKSCLRRKNQRPGGTKRGLTATYRAIRRTLIESAEYAQVLLVNAVRQYGEGHPLTANASSLVGRQVNDLRDLSQLMAQIRPQALPGQLTPDSARLVREFTYQIAAVIEVMRLLYQRPLLASGMHPAGIYSFARRSGEGG